MLPKCYYVRLKVRARRCANMRRMTEVGRASRRDGAAGLMGPIRACSVALFGPAVYRGLTGKPSVALTFDDGPSESTPRLLETLARHGAAATFFMTGANAARLPGVACAVRSAGHEIGNHSYSHSAFCFRSAGFIRAELEQAQRVIALTTGVEPRLFRPPFGTRWFGSRVARRLNLTEVLWTVMGRDWRLNAGQVVARVVARAAAGGIVCLHDGRELNPNPDIRATLEAVDRLIPLLRDRGFQFETVSQLCLMN